MSHNGPNNNDPSSSPPPPANPPNSPEGPRSHVETYFQNLKAGTLTMLRILEELSRTISAGEGDPTRTQIDQLRGSVTDFFETQRALEDTFKKLVDEEDEEVRNTLLEEIREIIRQAEL
ncbi:hypothetical protein G6011_05226 [Alternaria panax]|uniref:Uncharacterized protein n=1 Tax=Alternaria panax TaxID=48097 RepID=A0AAD4FDE0_9PLEO|nr:hypothetical protein G6011_05226 [Alternaria panax]